MKKNVEHINFNVVIKKERFQIVANTGETLGLPLETKEQAEEYIVAIAGNKTLLQELCPDSDISKITSFVIEPTTDY